MASNSEQRLQTLLHHFQIQSSNSMATITNTPRNKRSAVLICLFEGDDGNLRVILTQRASSLSTHAGEVALPGGKRDESDADDVETALREAKEEIGLDPSIVSVITVLDAFRTNRIRTRMETNRILATCDSIKAYYSRVKSQDQALPILFQSTICFGAIFLTKLFELQYGMTIIPVIGMLSNKDAFSPVIDSAEVEAVFDVPLEMFLKNDNRRAEEREWMGEKYLVHYFDYEVDNKKYVIWAVTAAMLIRAATLLLQRPPAFLEQRPKIWGGITENDMIMLQSSSKQ